MFHELNGKRPACLDGFSKLRSIPGWTEGFQDAKDHDSPMGWRDCILCSRKQMICIGGKVLGGWVILIIENPASYNRIVGPAFLLTRLNPLVRDTTYSSWEGFYRSKVL